MDKVCPENASIWPHSPPTPAVKWGDEVGMGVWGQVRVRSRLQVTHVPDSEEDERSTEHQGQHVAESSESEGHG